MTEKGKEFKEQIDKRDYRRQERASKKVVRKTQRGSVETRENVVRSLCLQIRTKKIEEREAREMEVRWAAHREEEARKRRRNEGRHQGRIAGVLDRNSGTGPVTISSIFDEQERDQG